MDDARFPAVSGEALDGTPFSSARDLAGTATVVSIGFALDQRAELESWVPYLDALVRSGRPVRARLLVPLAVPKLMRGALVGAMKSAVSAPELRASTIPLFVDVDGFCAALGIAERGHLVMLLVDANGRVVWRAAGAFTAAAGASLDAALAAV